MELPPEEGSPYSPEFYSGWEPPATDPQGRAWEDPVEKQLQHERRRRQVRRAAREALGSPFPHNRGEQEIGGLACLTPTSLTSRSKAPPRSLSMGE